jgi:hypothetical protein
MAELLLPVIWPDRAASHYILILASDNPAITNGKQPRSISMFPPDIQKIRERPCGG